MRSIGVSRLVAIAIVQEDSLQYRFTACCVIQPLLS